MYPFPTLPKRLSSFIFAQLCDELPPPRDDTPDSVNDRDMAAMAAVAALGPIDLTEAALAVRIVATDAHARDSLRLAGQNQADLTAVLRCRAQAASMMRQSQQALRSLERLQAMRPLAPPTREDAMTDAPAAETSAERGPDEASPDIAAQAVKSPTGGKPKEEDTWQVPPNNLPGFAQLWLLPAHVTRNQKPYNPHRKAY